MKDKIFNQFSLVGTALALQIGHRVSVDLDLFTTEKFDKNKIIEFFVENFEFSIDNEGEQMLITSINGIKVDFVKMAYPILYPSVVYNSIRILNIKDIAPMKLKAIIQRGSKKDFYDIYYLLNYLSLKEMLELFSAKFKIYDNFILLKSLTYFEDAENNPDPILLNNMTSWSEIKSRLRNEVSYI